MLQRLDTSWGQHGKRDRRSSLGEPLLLVAPPCEVHGMARSFFTFCPLRPALITVITIMVHPSVSLCVFLTLFVLFSSLLLSLSLSPSLGSEDGESVGHRQSLFLLACADAHPRPVLITFFLFWLSLSFPFYVFLSLSTLGILCVCVSACVCLCCVWECRTHRSSKKV